MPFRAWAGDVLLGESDLEAGDARAFVAAGDFVPSPEFEEYRLAFALEAEASRAGDAAEAEALRERYRELIDGFALSLTDDEGYAIPIAWLHVDAVESEAGAGLVLSAYVTDPAFFSAYDASGARVGESTS